MARILLATAGSLGDLHPYIALGQALIRRGHQVVLATTAEYAASVRAAQLEFVAVRPSTADLGDQAALARRLFNVWRGPERLVREVAMPWLREAYADITPAAHHCDLLVSHPLTLAVPLFAERYGKPWVSTVLAPLSFMSQQDPPKLAGLNLLQGAARLGPIAQAGASAVIHRVMRHWEAPLHRFRQELGLPATSKVMMLEGQFSKLATLALFDAPLAMPQADWPKNTHVCGNALFDGAAPPATVFAALQEFLSQGEPPIVFALGSSAVWFAGHYWRDAIQATQQLNRRAILLTGPGTVPPLPKEIRAFDYLPYSLVFPQAAVVVHQAGAGTLAQALRSGRPQLITPVAFDQPDNAARTVRLGVGSVLPFNAITSARLSTQLQPLLTQPNYVLAAQQVAADLQAVDGALTAARLIETFLK